MFLRKLNIEIVDKPFMSQCVFLAINYLLTEGYLSIIDILEIKHLQFEKVEVNVITGTSEYIVDDLPLSDEGVIKNNILQNFIFVLEHIFFQKLGVKGKRKKK